MLDKQLLLMPFVVFYISQVVFVDTFCCRSSIGTTWLVSYETSYFIANCLSGYYIVLENVSHGDLRDQRAGCCQTSSVPFS